MLLKLLSWKLHLLGDCESCPVGTELGMAVGISIGNAFGASLGIAIDSAVGIIEGTADFISLGTLLFHKALSVEGLSVE
jgi:hypothetical protein